MRAASTIFRIILIGALSVPILLGGNSTVNKTAAYQDPCVKASPTFADITACMQNMVNRPPMYRGIPVPGDTTVPPTDSSRFNRAVFAIQNGNGPIAFSAVNNNGLLESQKWNDQTIFSVGSMSKPVMAIALFKLIEEYPWEFGYNGANITQTLNKRVYTLPGMAGLTGGQKGNIKLINLLTHTGGFMSVSSCPECSPGVLWKAEPGLTNEFVFANGSWQSGRKVGTYGIAQYFIGQPLAYNPGNYYDPGFNYSNIDQIMIAAIIEATLAKNGIQMTFNNYVKTRIFQPLSMANSFFMAQPPPGFPILDEGVTPQQRDRIADILNANWDTAGGKLMPAEVAPPLVNDDWGRDQAWDEKRRDWVFAWPEGGMYSTANSLLKFLRMIKNNGAIINDNGQATGKTLFNNSGFVMLMKQDQIAAGNPWEINNYTVGDARVGKTAGFAVKLPLPSAADGALVSSLPNGTIHHLGRFMTFFWLTPGGQSGVFLSQQLPGLTYDGYGKTNRDMAQEPINKYSDMAAKMP